MLDIIGVQLLEIPCTMALVVNVALKKTEWTLCISINLNLSD